MFGNSSDASASSNPASGLFGTRKRNLLKELPWHELESDVMHTRDGHYLMAFSIKLPCTVFYDSYNGLLGQLKHMLEDELREGMRLRFMFGSGPADRSLLTMVKERVTAPEETLRYLLDERSKMMEEDWHQGSVRQCQAYCEVRVSKKAKKFFTLSRRRERERAALCAELRSNIMGAFNKAGYAAEPMDDQAMFRLVHRYLNPGCWNYEIGDYHQTWQRFSQKTVEKIPGSAPPTLRAQLAESKIDNRRPGHLIVGDHYVKMVALNKVPERRTFVNMMDAAMHGGEKFFAIVDLYHQSYHKGATTTRARARRFAAAADQTDLHVDAETRYMAADARGLSDHLEESQDHLFLASVGFVLYDQDLRHLNDRIEHLYTELQRIPGRPFRVLAQGLFTPFLQFAPLSGLDYTERVTLPTLNATHLFPVDGPYSGAETPVAIYRNRYYGLTNVDPFKGANYNGLVIGRSGSGKTFNMNFFLSEILSDKEKQVVVIDRGGGYQPLVEAAEGVTIPLSPGGGTTINPFDITPGEHTPNDLEKDNVLRIVRAMIPGEAGAEREIEDAVLMAAITQVYAGAKRYNIETDEDIFVPPTMTDLYKKLWSMNEVGEVRADDETQKLARRLATRLQGWTGNTPYGRFVDGQTSVPLSQARVVYYDTEGISGAGQLSVVGTLLIAGLVEQRVKARLGQKTLVVLDEGWAMLKASPEARGFVEEMFRRFRRYGAGIWAVSQSYEDFRQLSGISGNVEKHLVFGVDQAERALLVRELRLTKNAVDRLERVHQVKDKYSEAMCFFRGERGWEGDIIAIHPTKADRYCFTTNDDDMAIRQAKISETGNLLHALKDLSHPPDNLAIAA